MLGETNPNVSDGGYDEGYAISPCFWGRQPGSLVSRLVSVTKDCRGLKVLDAGCGEGKNAVFLASLGAQVRAIDISDLAIRNGQREFGKLENLRWEIGDIVTAEISEDYDIVIAYGLLHCLRTEDILSATLRKLQAATKSRGYHVVCTFNSRRQELSAHPGFVPTLMTHNAYLNLYCGWECLEASDSDLTEIHPHNSISHTHSLTRLIMRKP
jgi:2-polyprenyl-3-methyl-5-hydroxy-6-metoxy-1,4-benzoquinol methylase